MVRGDGLVVSRSRGTVRSALYGAGMTQQVDITSRYKRPITVGVWVLVLGALITLIYGLAVMAGVQSRA